MTLYFLLLLATLVVLVQLYSSRHGLDGVTYKMKLSKHLVEPDEVFSIQTTVRNTKRLPVLYLHISERIPEQLQTETGDVNIDIITHRLMNTTLSVTTEQTTYLLARQTAIRIIQAALPARGRYLFPSSELKCGDFLGLQEQSVRVENGEEIVVMPARAEQCDFPKTFGSYLGDISVRRFILADPILTTGFREYTGREPMKDISWPRSLRDGRMMVKQYDYTAERNVSVLLNISGGTRDETESCFSLARSICEELEHRRISYSFHTNAATANRTGAWSYLGAGIGAQHLSAILDGLGRASCDSCFPFFGLLRAAEGKTEQTGGYVLITPRLNREEHRQVCLFEQQTGRRVFFVEAPSAQKQEESAV